MLGVKERVPDNRLPSLGAGVDEAEVAMSRYVYSLIAGIRFLLITLCHLLRIMLGVTFVVGEISVPRWASGAAVIFRGFLAYEGLRLAR